MNTDVSIKVVGYSNTPQNAYTRNWIQSLVQKGFEYHLLGEYQVWEGVFTRIKSYNNYLKSKPANDTLYVLVDVYDILAVGTPTELFDKLSNSIQKSQIIISTEPNCNPNLCRPMTNYWDHHSTSSSNRYLNFGLVAGNRNSLLHFFEYIISNYKRDNVKWWNEQISASKYLDDYPEKVILDTEYNILGNIICHPSRGNVSKFSWDQNDKRVLYHKRDYISNPVFIHCPSKNIDAHQRYLYYGPLILEDKWSSTGWDWLKDPGYHWVLLSIIILILILLFIFGKQWWLIVILIILLLIPIVYYWRVRSKN